MVDEEFKDRVRFLVNRCGGPKKFSTSVGTSISVIYKWMNGESEPKRNHLAAMTDATDVDADWLLTGKGIAPDNSLSGKPNDSIIFIPCITGVESSENPPIFVEAEVRFALSQYWITQQLRSDPQTLRVMRVSGDAMAPTLNEGDWALIELCDRITQDGVYVLKLGVSLKVKRLLRLSSHLVQVTSDNPTYPPFEVDFAASDQDWQIAGRVLFATRKF